jgi:hypothetical protein
VVGVVYKLLWIGLVLIIIGTLLQFIPIWSNGGVMPVNSNYLIVSDFDGIPYYCSPEQKVTMLLNSKSKNNIITESTKFKWLCDIIPATGGYYCIGDFVNLTGIGFILSGTIKLLGGLI